MTDLQGAKALVRRHLTALDTARPGQEAADCAATLAPGHAYHGVHPFNSDTPVEAVWEGIKRAMAPIQRRPTIFLAGEDDAQRVWVTVMGHVLGDFTAPWLGIRPTGKLAFLPFVSFFRVEEGAIVETFEFLDILAVIDQAGLNPYAGHQTAAQIMAPGPRTQDGLLYGPQKGVETAATRVLCKEMLADLVQTMTSPSDHLARFWHRDMCWFGPTGIGACLGFEGYRRGHTGPFEEKLAFLDYRAEDCAVAEGAYAAFCWYPSLTMKNTGGYMGAPPSDSPGVMRIVDVYRRAGERLAENWIFIDMPHFLLGQGIDLLSEVAAADT